MSRTSTAALTVAALLLAAPAWSQTTRDHLQCYKIKDSLAKATYTADLWPDNLVFPSLVPGCEISVPARQLCIDVAKTNVEPAPPGSPDGVRAQSYLCYKAKCPKLATTAGVTDQFGDHDVEVKSTSMVCAPLDDPCGEDGDVCEGACVQLDVDNENCGSCGNVCADGSECVAGACSLVCDSFETDCSGTCVNLDTDYANCGGCGTVCSDPANATGACVDGACVVGSCAPDYADCNFDPGDGCEALLPYDPANCGACGNVCPGGFPTCFMNICI